MVLPPPRLAGSDPENGQAANGRGWFRTSDLSRVKRVDSNEVFGGDPLVERGRERFQGVRAA
jgi:hypothetical protein